jgi:polyphenol oxidase
MLHAPHLKELGSIEHGFGTRAEDAWLADSAHAWAKQIHGDNILRVKAEGLAGEADALITTTPYLWVGIRTADCLPILLADPVGQVVAAVHAGWRGTVAQIAVKTLSRMQELGAELSDIRAAIGPGIGLCCYEVGPEVSQHFGEEGQTCIDLAAANERQLVEAGLELDQIWHAKRCTKCDPGLFHSYRRDGQSAGRLLSAIRLV